MRRDEKKIAVGFTIAVALGFVVFFGYSFARTHLRRASIDLMVGPDSDHAPEMLEARLPPIPEEAQRTVFDRVIGAAENIQVVLASESPQANTLETRSLVSAAIHRIAIGNNIQDDDVIAIARWGRANNW